MSSATSIERTGDVVAHGKARRKHAARGTGDPPGPETGRAPAADGHDAFRPWHFFVLLSLIAATAAVVIARESRPEHLILISLIIGGAGFAAAALHRTLVPLVTSHGASSSEPLTEGMRAVLEREKLLTLRSIKELEFDRAMGKVSAADFDEMAGRLRTRAISLMKQLDAGGSAYREVIERELQARLGRRAPSAERTAQADGPSCQCGTVNDPDAAFCKRCGVRLQGATKA